MYQRFESLTLGQRDIDLGQLGLGQPVLVHSLDPGSSSSLLSGYSTALAISIDMTGVALQRCAVEKHSSCP
jgi:hypothetical protein